MDVQPCTPFSIGGVVGTAIASHVGYLPFLPRKYGKAFDSTNCGTNLVSLGYLLRRGGSYYATDVHGCRTLRVFDGDFLTSGKILMTSSQAPNNLYPVHEANSALAVPLASTVDVASFNLIKDCAYPNSFQ